MASEKSKSIKKNSTFQKTFRHQMCNSRYHQTISDYHCESRSDGLTDQL
jgi:hypothetical protein